MKLQELMEAKGDALLEKIKRECAPYLKLNPLRDHQPLFRGYNGGSAASHKRKVKKDRIPKDSSPIAHAAYRDYFISHFNKPYREISVFCTGNIDIAEEYGDQVGIVFPVGNFNYCWSPEIEDLFGEFEGRPTARWDKFDEDMVIRELFGIPYNEPVTDDHTADFALWKEKNYEEYLDIFIRTSLEDVRYYENEKLIEGIRSYHEVMIDCESYYLINLKTAEHWLS